MVESPAASTHTGDRMSARAEFVEVVTRGERRRRRSPEQKLRVVAEAMQPGAVFKAVARRAGIGTGLLYTWRREFLTAVAPAPSVLRLPAVVAEACPAAPPVTAALAPSAGPVPGTGGIEIALRGGAVVRVDAAVDEAALRRVLLALEGR